MNVIALALLIALMIKPLQDILGRFYINEWQNIKVIYDRKTDREYIVPNYNNDYR